MYSRTSAILNESKEFTYCSVQLCTTTFNFSGYEVTWEDETDTVSNIHTLQSDANTDNLQITSLSWNCTGSTIAAAYPLKIH